jgi:hypothetical protein
VRAVQVLCVICLGLVFIIVSWSASPVQSSPRQNHQQRPQSAVAARRSARDTGQAVECTSRAMARARGVTGRRGPAKADSRVVREQDGLRAEATVGVRCKHEGHATLPHLREVHHRLGVRFASS